MIKELHAVDLKRHDDFIIAWASPSHIQNIKDKYLNSNLQNKEYYKRYYFYEVPIYLHEDCPYMLRYIFSMYRLAI